jgi:soluble lytic murein transglycosylase-like protein
MILPSNIVRSYLYNAGFRSYNLDAAVQIAKCESGFNPDAHNTSGEDSRGLMQININANPQYSSYNLFDPQTNSNVAFKIYQAWGNNFGAWTCARQLGLVNPGYNTNTILFASFIGIALYFTLNNN